MNIVPLSKENLEDTIQMAHKAFPLDAAGENPPEKGFRKSLEIHGDEDLEAWHRMTQGKKISRLNYWVLLDENNKVVGVTGLYSFSEAPDEVWLAWFCLDPITRGKGLGRKLLNWTMEKARSEGYAKFRLYTSTDPNEAAAQNLYESVGLKITEEKDDPDSPYKLMYREVML